MVNSCVLFTTGGCSPILKCRMELDSIYLTRIWVSLLELCRHWRCYLQFWQMFLGATLKRHQLLKQPRLLTLLISCKWLVVDAHFLFSNSFPLVFSSDYFSSFSTVSFKTVLDPDPGLDSGFMQTDSDFAATLQLFLSLRGWIFSRTWTKFLDGCHHRHHAVMMEVQVAGQAGGRPRPETLVLCTKAVERLRPDLQQLFRHLSPDPSCSIYAATHNKPIQRPSSSSLLGVM